MFEIVANIANENPIFVVGMRLDPGDSVLLASESQISRVFESSAASVLFVDSRLFLLVDGRQVSGADAIKHLKGEVGGFIQIADTLFTTNSPMVLVEDVPSPLTNNAGSLIESYAPKGVSASIIWDPIAAKVLAPDVGESWTLRVSVLARPTLANRVLYLSIDIGNATPIIINTDVFTHTLGAGEWQLVTFEFSLYQLGTFAANGGGLQIGCNGSCEIAEPTFVFWEKGRP